MFPPPPDCSTEEEPTAILSQSSPCPGADDGGFCRKSRSDTDGNVVSKYILRSYQEEGREYIKQIRDEEEEAKKAAENVDTEVTDGEAEGNDDEVIEGDPGDDA